MMTTDAMIGAAEFQALRRQMGIPITFPRALNVTLAREDDAGEPGSSQLVCLYRTMIDVHRRDF